LTLARNFNIEGFFDFILTSASCSYRKPHPRIFELGLVHWGFSPDEAAMVGDTLAADILGAKRAGLFSIWYPAHVSNLDDRTQVRPDATVASLLEIPELLARIK
jgi:putative hydrolase of the HAD superfamily